MVRGMELVLLAPAREEVVFRGFLLHIFRNRMKGRAACLCCGLFFGMAHLTNAANPRFTWSFVMVQVMVASVIGTFLSTRTMATGRERGTADAVAIHVVNNLFASVVGTGRMDVTDWYVMVSLAQTTCLFGYLLQRDLVVVA
mmetsp:Transcript_21621/g.34630  ORF Transcript_21621/g.34630 Transcript_21621/m.34630 type:complete len:142 (+) Transcript_21621:167-592(+)